jgi:hypothetical protein
VRSRWPVAVVLVCALVGTAPAAAKASGRLTVSVDRTHIVTKLGHTFTVRSKVVNHAPVPAAGLIAHLNVLSLNGDVYVDPEDWSSKRTRYLAPMLAHGSTTISWKLDAVNAGTIGVYIAVLPRGAAGSEPTTGPLVRVRIASRRTLNAGGILPLALGVPAFLFVVAVSIRRTRGRQPRDYARASS